MVKIDIPRNVINSQHIDRFNPESHLDDTEKLALLNFLAKEFNLKQHFLPQVATNSKVVLQFIQHQFSSRNLKADLIYLSDADLNNFDPQLAENCLKLLSSNGIICVDGTLDIAILSNLFANQLEPILELSNFSVYARCDGENPIRSLRYRLDIFRRKYFVETTRLLPVANVDGLPLIAVVVLAYCHEQYITECLNSILMQKGNFRMRVIILDDASPDKTAEVVKSVIAGQSNDRVEFDFRRHPENIGMVKNFGESIRLGAECDYLTFCEGDDFWSSDTRIQQHLDFLAAHPECIMSFNSIEKCAADGSSREIFSDHANNPDDILDGLKLAANNLCGNLAGCFYHGSVVKVIPPELFDLYTGDWMLNMYCAQFGGVGHLRKVLSVYRQHDGGVWSGEKQNKVDKAWQLIGDYNLFLDYQYDQGFQQYKKRLLTHWAIDSVNKQGKFDLLIMDDVFPSPRSGFSLAEFTMYLNEFPTSIVLTTGLALPVLDDKTLKEVLQSFQRQNPTLGNRLISEETMISDINFPVKLFKLLYVHFLTKAYALLPLAEAAHVPFVFTLYPGSGFVLNNPECDKKLKRVFDSPCFLKVIVTQQITFDYIVSRNLCPVDKVEMIFGVVMPQEALSHSSIDEKLRWGFGKDRLDICFMAHRYTQYGEDKGYDVFVNVASALCQSYDNIFFHVVGPYDHRVINVDAFKEKIVFHGSLDPEQFDGFFQTMDLIMSPNISGKIFPGSFDGFPTASCTEAGLRGTAIFATDEFNSGADGRFTDGENIVLIHYDLKHITDKVEDYYKDPAKLKLLGEKGRERILELYSYESQMLPRIKLLREAIDSSHPEALKSFYGNSKIKMCQEKLHTIYKKCTAALLHLNKLT